MRFSFPFDAGPFVWLLLVLSFLALVFVVERALFLHRGLVLSSDFIEGVRNNLRAGRPLEALAACEESPGPVPRVVKAALLRASSGEEAMRAAATEAALLELPVLERRLGTIAAIGRVAPLLGLAGAIFAGFDLATALRDGSVYGSADGLLLGVQSALATAGFAMVIAAGCALGHHFLVGRVRSIVTEMEIAAHSIITFVRHELPEEKPRQSGDAHAPRSPGESPPGRTRPRLRAPGARARLRGPDLRALGGVHLRAGHVRRLRPAPGRRRLDPRDSAHEDP
jgi:biopolymer transport protein ExbB